MAKDGEILNRSILKKVSDVLKIGAIKQFPTQLNLDDVKVVFDLSYYLTTPLATPNGEQGVFQLASTAPTLAGLNDARTGLLQGAEDGVKAFRIDSIWCKLNFTSTAAGLYNGKSVRLHLLLAFESGDPGESYIITLNPWVTVATARLDYYWSLAGGISDGPLLQSPVHRWTGRVPAQGSAFGEGILRLYARIVSIDGTTFPSGTTIQFFTQYRLSDNGVMPVE